MAGQHKTPYSIRDVQMTDLSILRDIRDFCDRNGLRYYLYCGTLLGCIRHSGFITWDDDADLAMPLRDYRIFRKTFPDAFPGKYHINTQKTDPDFRHPWIQVCREGTEFCLEKELPLAYHKGIAVDVYPMIGVPSGPLRRKLQYYLAGLARILLYTSYYQKAGRGIKNSLTFRKTVGLIPSKARILIGRLICRLIWLDPEKHRDCGTIDVARLDGKYRWKDWQETETRLFEGEPFTVPKEYDRLLRTMYGDYMQLPPEKDRISHYSDEDHLYISEAVLQEIREER